MGIGWSLDETSAEAFAESDEGVWPDMLISKLLTNEPGENTCPLREVIFPRG